MIACMLRVRSYAQKRPVNDLSENAGNRPTTVRKSLPPRSRPLRIYLAFVLGIVPAVLALLCVFADPQCIDAWPIWLRIPSAR